MYSRSSIGRILYRAKSCPGTAVESTSCCSLLGSKALVQHWKLWWQNCEQQQQQQQQPSQWQQPVAATVSYLAMPSQQQPLLCWPSMHQQSWQQQSWQAQLWQQQQQQQQHIPLGQQLRHYHPSTQYSTHGDANTTKATTILCIRNGPEVVIIGDGQATQKDFIVKSNVRKVRRIGPNAVGGFAGVAVDGLSLLERLEAKLEEHPGQLQRAAVELAKMWRQDKILRELDASLVVADAETTLWLMGNGDVLEVAADGVMSIGSGADFAESAARALLQLQRERQRQQQQGADSDAAASRDNGKEVSMGEVKSDGSVGCEEQSSSSVNGREVLARRLELGVGDRAARPVEGMTLMEIAQLAMKIAADCCVYTNYNFTWHHIQPDGSIVSGDTPQQQQQQQQQQGGER